MSVQFEINHIRNALLIARELAADIGTDLQRGQIKYAERMLRMIEDKDYPPAIRAADAAFYESGKAEFSKYGHD